MSTTKSMDARASAGGSTLVDGDVRALAAEASDLVKTDIVRAGQVRTYLALLGQNSPTLDWLESEDCSMLAVYARSPRAIPADERASIRDDYERRILKIAPRSHVWLRGIIATYLTVS